MTKKPCDPNDNQEILERIAHALDHPASDFFEVERGTSREAETLALVTTFARITDSQARARCIAFVTAEAERASRD